MNGEIVVIIAASIIGLLGTVRPICVVQFLYKVSDMEWLSKMCGPFFIYSLRYGKSCPFSNNEFLT